MLNDKGVMTQFVIVERRVRIGSLHVVPLEHYLFIRHRLEWMARSVGSYNEYIVRGFYASYVGTL